ncbi:uncharacterized membrane protein YtjA (UPF0391 family) [Paraburkholderia caribensis]|jgi:uncharacterized membrane protein YtjA (UPF0391 family)|nr:uncharacterized membrane protein YtjA (UPF0391 family) [Paraburkholderia caribensis]
MGTGVAPCRDGGACVRQCGSRAWVGHRIDLSSNPLVETSMLRYAAIFFVIAIIAAVFGFGGIAAGAAEIAKVLFFIFIVIFLVTLLMGVIRR